MVEYAKTLGLSKEERETIIIISDDAQHWEIYSEIRKHCTKIRKLRGVEVIEETHTPTGTVIAGRYKLPARQISFRHEPAAGAAGKRKNAGTENLKKARKAKGAE